MSQQFIKAPTLQVERWFNTDSEITLDDLAGKVVVIEAFQMLCPRCVSHGLPLARLIYDTFPREKVAVIGLHTVFEHHAAMAPVSLEAFLFEYKIPFPVGVDQPGDTDLPQTMAAYSMRGTPSLILIDAQGNLRANYFGQVSELRIGAEIATLISECIATEESMGSNESTGPGCDESGCSV